MNKNLGQEPAFPIIVDTMGSTAAIYKGMSTRLYIATAAMQGILSSTTLSNTYNWKWIVEKSLSLADLLLEEESKTQKTE